MKRIVGLAALLGAAAIATPIHAATYVVLPSPGSIVPATIVIDDDSRNPDRLFVCSSFTDIAAGTCHLHRRGAKR